MTPKHRLWHRWAPSAHPTAPSQAASFGVSLIEIEVMCESAEQVRAGPT